jgi:hypothetical protein
MDIKDEIGCHIHFSLGFMTAWFGIGVHGLGELDDERVLR